MATILIVDDDPDTRELLGRYLEAVAGHRAVLAADGAEALAVLAREPVDLIVLDLLMPRMGGVEFLAAVGDAERIPVLVCSGLDGTDLRAELSSAGVAGVLCKDDGFFIDLIDAVSRHLPGQPAGPSPAVTP